MLNYSRLSIKFCLIKIKKFVLQLMQEMVLIQDNSHKFKIFTMVFFHWYSVNEFIVDDDDDEDQEDDVFIDPGFTPELEEISDDDKENEDIEIATPGTLVGELNPVEIFLCPFTFGLDGESKLIYQKE